MLGWHCITWSALLSMFSSNAELGHRFTSISRGAASIHVTSLTGWNWPRRHAGSLSSCFSCLQSLGSQRLACMIQQSMTSTRLFLCISITCLTWLVMKQSDSLKVWQLCYRVILAFFRSFQSREHYSSRKNGSGSCGTTLPFVDVLYLTVWVMAQGSACLAVLSAGHCSSWHWQLPVS